MNLRTLSRTLIGTIILVCLGFAAFAATVSRGTAQAPPLVGTRLDLSAPNFTLPDQTGSPVSLNAERGHLVVLTFFYAHCPDTCPMTAQKLRTILRKLGSESRRIRVLIVSTDPLHDTRASVRSFLAKHGQPSWHWLVGSYPNMLRVWRLYHVYAPNPMSTGSSAPTHSAVIYLINSTGKERAILNDTEPAAGITRDLHIMLNDHDWTATAVAPTVGGKAPSFALPSLEGSRLTLSRFRGRPLVLNFWATWCVPCNTEMPLLERAYRSHHGGLDVVGLDQQEPGDEVRSYTHSVHVTYPIALDDNGNVSYRYQIAGTPTTFFISRSGVIAARVTGELKSSTLAKNLRTILGS